MKSLPVILGTAALAIVVAGCSTKTYADGMGYSSDNVVSKVETTLGELYADANGLTLYTFTKDGKGQSNCYDGCAAKWPPLMAKADAAEWGAFSVIARNDGTYQWAYGDQPLYTWVGDQKPGDTNGQGVGNVWYVVKTGY